MKRNFLLLLIVLFNFAASNPQPSGTGNTVINIDLPVSIRSKCEVKLSDFATDIEFIQLETTKECLINAEKSECFIAGNYILVVSRKPVGVMLFDRKGKFLRRIGQVGKGPDEYAFIDTGCIDPSGQFIFLIDPMTNKFYKYSITGKLLLQKPYNSFARFRDVGMQKLVFIDKTHLALTPLGKGKAAGGFCHVLVLDTNLSITDSLLKASDSMIFEINGMFREELNSIKGGVALWKPYLGSIYYLYPDGKVIHKYQLNLGSKKTLEENLKKPEEFEQPPYSLTMVRDLPDYLAIFGFTPTDEFLAMVYNKKTGKAGSLEFLFHCSGFEQRKLQVFSNDLTGLPFLPLIEVNYFENIIYCLYDTQGNIDNQLNCIQKIDVLLPERRDELIRQIKGRTEYENPLLMVMKLK